MSFINLCLRVPNLDNILFYLIFVILIPYYLLLSGDVDTLKFYLPALVMIAVTLTESGKPSLFVDLYPSGCDMSLSGFLSKNFINLLAALGLLYQSVKLAINTNNIWVGVMNGIVSFAITFPLAQSVLPFFINQGDQAIRSVTRENVSFPGNWHKYIIGAFYIILLMGLQYFALMGTYNYFLGNY
jgi:hypothetical protein